MGGGLALQTAANCAFGLATLGPALNRLFPLNELDAIATSHVTSRAINLALAVFSRRSAFEIKEAPFAALFPTTPLFRGFWSPFQACFWTPTRSQCWKPRRTPTTTLPPLAGPLLVQTWTLALATMPVPTPGLTPDSFLSPGVFQVSQTLDFSRHLQRLIVVCLFHSS